MTSTPILPLPGSKHKLMLEGQSVQPRRRSKLLSSRLAGKSKRMGAKGSVGVGNKSFHCELCEIYVNSETQLKQVGVAQTRADTPT